MSIHVPFKTADNSPDRENHIRKGRQQFQLSVLGNFQHVGTHFGYFQPHCTQVENKRELTTGPQTYLTTKNLDECTIDKLCLMTVPPKGRHRAERNRTKLYARIKHSMLVFTSISVNKKYSSYNSVRQKKIKMEQRTTDKGQVVNKTYLFQASVRNITII